jgi:hypothetical protein
MYNLLYYQAIVQLCLDLTDAEKRFVIEKYGMQEVNVDDIGGASSQSNILNNCSKLGVDGAKNLPTALALVLQNLYKPGFVKFDRNYNSEGEDVSQHTARMLSKEF